MKNNFLLRLTTVAILAIVVAVFFLWRRNSRFEAIPAPAFEPKASPAAREPRVRPTPLARVAMQPAPKSEVPSDDVGEGIELGDGIPYHRTVLRMARQHPELNITDPEALQSIYTNLCERRAALEASLAKVNEISPTQNLVEIPAYPEQGKVLLEELAGQVMASYGEAGAQKIMAVLGPLFAGDNHDLGKSPQKLAITKVTGETYEYQVVRETTMSDPVTKQPIGAARGIDTLRKDAMGMYAQQICFFPRG